MKQIITILLILSSIVLHSQNFEETKNVNIIFTVNNEIAFNLWNFKIIDEKGNDFAKAQYLPGILSIDKTIYEEIISGDKAFYLSFYDPIEIGTSNNNLYRIPMNQSILNSNDYESFFCVVAIFNRDDKKFKNRFKIVPKEYKYIYDLIFGGYSILQQLGE